jgi:hypothetical protein
MNTISREDARRVLDLPLPPDNDAGAATVRDYLLKLLSELWRHETGFDAKKPFGNSGWQFDVYVPLIQAGLTKGTVDADGEVGDDFDYRETDRLILAAIDELRRA